MFLKPQAKLYTEKHTTCKTSRRVHSLKATRVERRLSLAYKYVIFIIASVDECVYENVYVCMSPRVSQVCSYSSNIATTRVLQCRPHTHVCTNKIVVRNH